MIAASGLLRGLAASQDDVAGFEADMAARFGVDHALALPLARTGLYLAIKAIIRPGQAVILSPYTIAEVINMVICAGGRPVFCDTRRETCNMDPEALRDLLLQTEDVGAVLMTHFYGLASDIGAVAELCEAQGVALVEDAAQALGAVVDGRPVGTFGTAGVFSFGLFKSVNAVYGGLVVTKDAAVAARMRHIWQAESLPPSPRWLARRLASAAQTDIVTRDPLFSSVFFRLFRWAVINGVNSVTNRLKIDIAPVRRSEMPADYLHRMSDLQVRLVRRGLVSLPADLVARQKNAARYREGLSGLSGLVIPPEVAAGSHVYWYFAIQHDEAPRLVEHVLRQGQDITISYHRNCADLDCFAEYRSECPNARATARSLIYLPCYPGYGAGQIDRTIAAIRGFFAA